MRPFNAKLEPIIEPAVAAVGLELLGCEYVAGGRSALLRVYIDSPEGVTIDDCERASRQISAVLDVENPIPGNYRLEISSPGLDRPLFKLAHYVQFVGRQLKLRTVLSINRQRNFTAKLKAVEGAIIILELDNDIIELDFSAIDKANLVPDS